MTSWNKWLTFNIKPEIKYKQTYNFNNIFYYVKIKAYKINFKFRPKIRKSKTKTLM